MKKYIGYIVTYIFLLTFIDGALSQVQIALLSGRVVVPNIILKFILTICLAFGFLAYTFKHSKILYVNELLLPYVAFIIYLFIHFFVQIEKNTVGYLFFSYNSYYYYLLILPAASYVHIKKSFFSNNLFYFAIPLILLGYVQYLTQSPILPLNSIDAYFNVISWQYYDKIRAFSLFTSGMAYGHFLSLLGGLVTCWIVMKKGLVRFGAIIILLIVSGACYTTMTRNIYVQFIFVVMASYFLITPKSKSRNSHVILVGPIKYLPILYGVLAASVVYAGQLYVLSSGSSAAIIKDDSLKMRLLEWAYYIPLWTSQGTGQFLFGTGIMPSSRVTSSDEYIPDIDNSFLAVGVHSGLIGLLLWCFFMWRIWLLLLHATKKYPNNIPLLAITALWSTWISSGLFNIGLSMYPLLAIIAMALYSSIGKHSNHCTVS